jgi:catechol 2,3-dioxygenase-like lactoylglutathione lyase family enzyme
LVSSGGGNPDDCVAAPEAESAMTTVRGIDHINLSGSAQAVVALRDFYCDVIGLQVGPRPALRSAGLWLYADGSPVVHLVEAGDTQTTDAPSGKACALDHVAFRCSDLGETLERLRRYRIEHAVREVPATGQVQVRLHDPSGLLLELLFPLEPSGRGQVT